MPQDLNSENGVYAGLLSVCLPGSIKVECILCVPKFEVIPLWSQTDRYVWLHCVTPYPWKALGQVRSLSTLTGLGIVTCICDIAS